MASENWEDEFVENRCLTRSILHGKSKKANTQWYISKFFFFVGNKERMIILAPVGSGSLWWACRTCRPLDIDMWIYAPSIRVTCCHIQYNTNNCVREGYVVIFAWMRIFLVFPFMKRIFYIFLVFSAQFPAIFFSLSHLARFIGW